MSLNESLQLSIEKYIEDYGGIDKFLKKVRNVPITPNFLMKKEPEYALTALPMVVKVLCEKLVEICLDIT
ncbi:iron-sulfur protein, partial [Clostridioides difficile]|nr:iron-sulfur protein [Clostridioides difficile]